MKHLNVVLFVIALSVISLLIGEAESTIGRICVMKALASCGVNETCVQKNVGDKERGSCQCLPEFEERGGTCIERVVRTVTPVTSPSTDSSPQSYEPVSQSSGKDVIEGIVWTGCILLSIGGILFMIARRYKWFDRLHKLSIRSYNTVLVSSSNDDDAPIT